MPLKQLLVFLSLIILAGCKNNSGNLLIEPIDENLNGRLITGQGLNPNYYSQKDLFQYYEVANDGALPADSLFLKLNTFISKKYKRTAIGQASTLTVFFYKKSWFNNYDKHIYEAAMYSENGNIEDYHDDLLARIWLVKLNKTGDQYLRYCWFYKQGAESVERKDTVDMKNVFLR